MPRFSRTLLTAAVVSLAVRLVVGCRASQDLGVDRPTVDGDGGGLDGLGRTDAQPVGDSPFTIVQQLPGGGDLVALWGADRDHLVAVGTHETSFIYRSGVWERLGGAREGSDFSGVWGRTAKDVFAVGARNGRGFISHFDGKSWAEVFDAPVQLNGVWGTPDGVVLAVGAGGALYASHAGSEWRSFGPLEPNHDLPLTPLDPFLWAITGRNFDDFTIASSKNRVFHSVPNQGFEFFDAVEEPAMSFRSAWQAPGPSTSVFLGTNNFGLTWFTSTTGPTIEEGGVSELVRIAEDRATEGAANKFIQGVWGWGTTVVGVGDEGRIVRADIGVATSSRVPSPTNANLGAVWGSSLDDIWVVGERELIMHGKLPASAPVK